MKNIFIITVMFCLGVVNLMGVTQSPVISTSLFLSCIILIILTIRNMRYEGK